MQVAFIVRGRVGFKQRTVHLEHFEGNDDQLQSLVNDGRRAVCL